MRGLTEVAVMTPKLPPFTDALGRENWGWLKVSKNSARNWTAWLSWTVIDFASDISQLFWPGPRTMPPAALPKTVVVASEGIPKLVAVGGAQNTPRLK